MQEGGSSKPGKTAKLAERKDPKSVNTKLYQCALSIFSCHEILNVPGGRGKVESEDGFEWSGWNPEQHTPHAYYLEVLLLFSTKYY